MLAVRRRLAAAACLIIAAAIGRPWDSAALTCAECHILGRALRYDALGNN
jgi:hypothetical protein